MLVMINHASCSLKPPGGWAGLATFPLMILNIGTPGVRTSLVLSGYLVTAVLLAERGRTGSIALLDFHVRRAFRILPALYTYIATIVLLSAGGLINVRPRAFFHAATFTWIYNFGEWNWYLGHTWSLSVQEQFYLAWPLALLVLGLRGATLLAFGTIVVVPLAGICLPMFSLGVARRACYILSTSHGDVFMPGCLVALWWGRPTFAAVLARMARRRATLVVLGPCGSARPSLAPDL